MTAKHTEGPWLRDATSGLSCDVRATNGRKVALCWGLSTSRAAKSNSPAYRAECDANARLIAAAPELLDELVKVEKLLASIELGDYPVSDELESVRAAIAKAEGKA